MPGAQLYRRKWVLVQLPIALLAAAVVAWIWGALWPMPPTSLAISSGGTDGLYHAYAQRYATRFASEGVQLRVDTSGGAVENLRRLTGQAAPAAQLAFVQGGTQLPGARPAPGERLVTLARVDVEPLWIFTRRADVDSLHQLQGQRVSLGPAGSGTRQLAEALLAQVRMSAADVVASDLTGQDAVDALRQGKLDAVILVMSTGAPLVQAFFAIPGIHLVQLGHTAALIERLPALQARLLPAGAVDPARRQPPRDTTVLVTTASLLARADLHPALQRLAVDVARDIHAAPGPFHRGGEFPTLRRVEYPASAEARQTLSFGRPWVEEHLPFWWAQLAWRLAVLVLPAALLAWWLAHLVPGWIRWSIEARLVRWYGELKYIEDDLERDRLSGKDLTRHLERLANMERRMRAFTPPDDLLPRWFMLNQHIRFVQDRLLQRRGR